MCKKVLIISSSMRNKSNSEKLAEQFAKGAEEAGNNVEIVSLKGKQLDFCQGCLACSKTGYCVLGDEGNEIAEKMKQADVIVFTTPIYYYEMSNGWTVILTIPFQTVLMGERNLPVMTMVGISALVIVAMLVMVIRDLVNSRRIRQADTTIHILSDSFYAIYRVNYKTGVYEAIKTSPDVADALSKTGDYQRLLSTVGTLVDPETFQEFSLAFSLESIRQRVAAKIPDYGGDYQRRFGDVYKWVNIRTLYDGSRAPDEVILCFREVDLEKRLQEAAAALWKNGLCCAA